MWCVCLHPPPSTRPQWKDLQSCTSSHSPRRCRGWPSLSKRWGVTSWCSWKVRQRGWPAFANLRQVSDQTYIQQENLSHICPFSTGLANPIVYWPSPIWWVIGIPNSVPKSSSSFSLSVFSNLVSESITPPPQFRILPRFLSLPQHFYLANC